MAHLLNIKNTILPSHSFSSTHAHRPFLPSSQLHNIIVKFRAAPPAFSQAFVRKIESKRSYGPLRIRCLSGSSGAGQIEESLKTQITQNPVVIYSKTWCPYCQEVKGLFQELGVKPYVVELDELGTGERQVQDALRGLTGQSTVPNIFVGGRHIGGCSDTMELHQNGELVSLLSAAGIKVS